MDARAHRRFTTSTSIRKTEYTSKHWYVVGIVDSFHMKNELNMLDRSSSFGMKLCEPVRSLPVRSPLVRLLDTGKVIAEIQVQGAPVFLASQRLIVSRKSG